MFNQIFIEIYILKSNTKEFRFCKSPAGLWTGHTSPSVYKARHACRNVYRLSGWQILQWIPSGPRPENRRIRRFLESCRNALHKSGTGRVPTMPVGLLSAPDRPWGYRLMALATREKGGVLPYDELRQFLAEKDLGRFPHQYPPCRFSDTREASSLPLPDSDSVFRGYLRTLPVEPRQRGRRHERNTTQHQSGMHTPPGYPTGVQTMKVPRFPQSVQGREVYQSHERNSTAIKGNQRGFMFTAFSWLNKLPLLRNGVSPAYGHAKPESPRCRNLFRGNTPHDA